MTSEELEKHIDEIAKLYDTSNAEKVCVTHMLTMVSMLGYSKPLTAKCLKVLAAIFEVMIDNDKRNK
jgi:hypothetical protein